MGIGFRLPAYVVLTVVSTFVLAACGGGSGGSPDEQVSKPVTTLTVSESGLRFFGDTKMLGSVSSQAFSAVLENAEGPVFIGATYTRNGLEDVTATITGNTAQILVIPKFPGQMSVGLYEDVITLNACKDSGCQEHFSGSPAQVRVDYEIVDEVLAYDKNFAFTLGKDIGIANESITLIASDETNWEVTSNADWLQVPVSTGVGSAEVGLQLKLSAIPSGEFTTDLIVKNRDTGFIVTPKISVKFSKPQYLDAISSVEIGDGHGVIDELNKITIALDVGENKFPARLEVDENLQGLISTDLEITTCRQDCFVPIKINFSGEEIVHKKGKARLVTNVLGEDVSHEFELSVNRGKDYLVAERDHVALTKTNGAEKLSRNVRIRSRFGNPNITWVAESNQPWLTVSQSGSGNNYLLMSANPNGLPLEQISYAEVKVSSGELAAELTINVALWNGGAVNDLSGISSYVDTMNIVTDTWRPYAYIFDQESVHKIHLYHGAEIGSIDIDGTIFDVYSSHGKYIYAYYFSQTTADRGEPGYLVAKIDPLTFSVVENVSINDEYPGPEMVVFSVRGEDYFLFSYGGTYSSAGDLIDGMSALSFAEGVMAMNIGESTLCAADCYRFGYSETLDSLIFYKSADLNFDIGSRSRLFRAINRDGTKLYGKLKWDIPGLQVADITLSNPIGMLDIFKPSSNTEVSVKTSPTGEIVIAADVLDAEVDFIVFSEEHGVILEKRVDFDDRMRTSKEIAVSPDGLMAILKTDHGLRAVPLNP